MAEPTAGERRYRAARPLRDFTAIPNGVLRHPGLSGNAKALYAIMLDIVLFRRDEPDLPALGRLVGGGEKTARAAIRELQDEGLLEQRRRGRGQTNAYLLLEPADGPQDDDQERPRGPFKGEPRTAPGADLSRARVQPPGTKTAASPAAQPSAAPPRLVKIDGQNLGLNALCDICGIDPSGNRVGQAVAALNGSAKAGLEFGIRELVWRSLVERHGITADGMTPAERERFEQVVADEVREKAALYRRVMRDAVLTPTALARWWTDLRLAANGEGRGLTPDEIAARYGG